MWSGADEAERSTQGSRSPMMRLPIKLAIGGTVLLLAFAPLPFGGTVFWSRFAVALAAPVLLLLALCSERPVARPRPDFDRATRMAVLLLAGFLIVPALQMVPLPGSAQSVLFPVRAKLNAALAGIIPAGGRTPGTVDAGETFRIAIQHLGGICVLGVIFLAARTRRSLILLAWALVASGAFQAAYGFAEYATGRQHIFGFEKRWYLDSATGTFINRNHFAGYLALTLPFALGLARYSLARAGGTWRSIAAPRGGQAILAALAAVVMAVGLMASGSRGGWISVAFALLLANVLVPFTFGRRIFWGFLAVFLTAAVILAALIGTEPVAERMGRLPKDAATTEGRIEAWRVAARMAGDAPLLGVGEGTFKCLYPAYRRPSTTWNFRHAHCDYLQTLAETGATGFLFLFGGIGCALLVALRGWSTHGSRLAREVCLATFTASVAILVHGLFDFNLQIPSNHLTFFAVLGLGLAAAWMEEGNARTAHPGWRQTLAGMALALAAMYPIFGWFVSQSIMAQVKAEQRSVGNVLDSADIWHRIAEACRAAHRAWPLDPGPCYEEGKAWLRLSREDPESLNRAMEAFERALVRGPYHGRAAYWLGWTLARSGKGSSESQMISRAEAAVLRGADLEPENLEIREGVGDFYLYVDRSDDAARWYARTLAPSLDPLPRVTRKLLARPGGYDLAQRAVPDTVQGRVLFSEVLFAEGRFAASRSQWLESRRLGGQPVAPEPFGPERLANGSFEHELGTSWHDWQVEPVMDVNVSRERGRAIEGEFAMRLDFFGPVNYFHLVQDVPAVPGARTWCWRKSCWRGSLRKTRLAWR